VKHNAYVNGYLYVNFRWSGEGEDAVLTYCGGVNIRRFRPLTWGRHGQFMNPAFRGLQLLRLRVVIPAVQQMGGTVTRIKENPCPQLPEGEGWFRESFELKGVPEDFPDRHLVPFARELAYLVVKVCLPGAEIPADVSAPARLEAFLDSLPAS